jgi:hypothetical protein
MTMKIIFKIYKWFLERKMKDEYDPAISRKLDCIIYLLDNWRRE